MKKLTFEKHISANAQKVCETMLGLKSKKTYEAWTAEFNPTSTYEGQWVKGGKIYFLGTTEDGKRVGMVSEIAEFIPFQFVSIRHYGLLDGETEITEGAEVEKWAGGFENYFFVEHNGETIVQVEVDTIDEYKDYFNQTWPKALAKLKELAEK